MIYTPLIPTERPKISFGSEIRTPSESDSEDQKSTTNDITEVEYSHAKRKSKKAKNPYVKIKLHVEIINKMAKNNDKYNKQHQMYRSCLT